MNDMWSQYRISEEEATNQEEMVSPQSNPIDWSKYRQESDKGFLEKAGDYALEGGRHLARTGSRVGETILGLPGDFINFSKWIGDKLENVGSQIPGIREMQEYQNKKQSDFPFMEELRDVIDRVPSSQELKEVMSNITDGFTDPQSAAEEYSDSVIELASVLSFGKDPTKIRNLLSSLGKAFGAKTAAKGAGELGAGEGTKLAVEMGTLGLMSLFDPKMADKYVSDKYRKSQSLIPSSDKIKTSKLHNDLLKVERELQKGISTPTKKEVQQAISELSNKTSRGRMSAEELVESYHNINERMNSKSLFDDLSKSERKTLKHRYDKVKSAVNSEIKSYGKKNPAFFENWREANEGFSVIQKSKKATEFINKHSKKIPFHLAGGIAIEVLTGHPNIAAATAGSFGAMKTGELFYRISRSPVLRKAYLNALQEASAENLPAFIKETGKLEEGLQKSFIKK